MARMTIRVTPLEGGLTGETMDTQAENALMSTFSKVQMQLN